MPPPLDPTDLSRSTTPEDIENDIPATIPATQSQGEEDPTEDQLEQELVETTEPMPSKKTKGKSQAKGKSSRKPQKVSEAKEPEKSTNGDAEEGKEGEYEVEEIIDHRFVKKQCLYRVRWRDWTEDDDTWEPEEHLLPDSSVLLADYHIKIGGTPQPAKQVRKQSSKANVRKAPDEETAEDKMYKRAKFNRTAQPAYLNPGSEEWKTQPVGTWHPYDAANWEDLVHHVETVERDEAGNLQAFIRFRNGKRSKVAHNLYTSRCPRAMLKFYESHLSV